MRARLLLLLALLSLGLLLFACPDPRRGPEEPDDDDAGEDDDDSAPDDDDSAPDDDDVVPDDDDVAPDDDDTEPPSPCDEATSRLTNIGCDFWAVDLDNAENFTDEAAAAQFAVAVANVHDSVTAHVQVWMNTAPQGDPALAGWIQEAFVAPGDLHVFDLPRRDVDGDNVTDGVDDGPQTWLSSRAFRITSDAPVVVYQFNPIDQQFSNDASLLLPTHSLGVEHHVLIYGPNVPFEDMGPFEMDSPMNRTYVTVVGAHENTEVTVTPTFDIAAGEGVDEVEPGLGIVRNTSRTFTIGPYDVLNLETPLLPFGDFQDPDLTGTLVTSTEPVAVFTGTDLSVVTSGVNSDSPCCAEHLEEQVLPTRAMRNNFVVSHSAQRSTTVPEHDVYRIMAGSAGATVTTSLPAPDDSFTLGAGEFHQLISDTGFTVQSTAAIHVAQYLVAGEDLPSGTTGDSSMIYVMPAEQRRPDYTFTTGEGFTTNYVVVSMVDGTHAELDGVELSAAGCVGPASDGVLLGEAYVSWTCAIADGVHKVLADANVAIYVYGYYSAGSYAYPGGAGVE